MARFQITGINDKRDFCQCCGKSGLQRVVWILDTETGDEKHFGTSCAAKPAKGFDLDKEIKAAVRSINEALKLAYSRAFRAYKADGGKMINGSDNKGSPIAWPADQARYDALRDIEVRKVYV